MKKPSIILVLLLLGGGAYFLLQDEPAPNTIETEELEAAAPQPSDPKNIPEVLAEELPGLIDDYADHRKKQDSIRRANREEIYGIQIGLAKSNEKDALDAYKMFSTKSKSVKVFKISKNEYFIVKQDGSSKEELETSLKDLATNLNEKDLDVIDLMDYCGKRQKVKEESQKINKENVPCLICD